MLGPDTLGDTDASARGRPLAAYPSAAIAALVSGPSILERTEAHGVPATRTLCKPIARHGDDQVASAVARYALDLAAAGVSS